MKIEKITKRKKPCWWIFKRIAVGLFGLLLFANFVFYWTQEYFLIEAAKNSSGYPEPDKDPSGYAEMQKLKPSYNRFVSPHIGLLPESEDVESKVDVAIHFQKFDSPSQPARGKLFYLHGNRGSIEKCRFEIKPFLDAGYDVWTMDYRGFGKSKGPISEVNLLADAQMVYKEILKTEEIDIVWGRSFGSCTATYLAKENKPKRLVLETPYWSLPDAGCKRFPILIPELFRYRLPTHEYLEYVKSPVRIIHGTSDEKIYFGSSEKLEEHGKKFNPDIELYRIEGGKHNLRPSKLNPSPDIDKAFEDAFSKCLK